MVHLQHPVCTPEIGWQKCPFVQMPDGALAQCIATSHHNSTVCRKVSGERSSVRTSTVKRLSQRSLQCEPSCCHATAGKAHCDCASATQEISNSCFNTLRCSQSVDLNGLCMVTERPTVESDDSDTAVYRMHMVWPTGELRCAPTDDSHPAPNQHDSR